MPAGLLSKAMKLVSVTKWSWPSDYLTTILEVCLPLVVSVFTI